MRKFSFIPFIWIGFVSAISFMEAWLKFQAPLMTVPIGLSVGRLIFSALNKVEWCFALLMVRRFNPLLAIPLLILAIQTFLLLPALNLRVEIALQGGELPSSLLHVYYLSLEAIKVGCLFIIGIKSYENSLEKSI